MLGSENSPLWFIYTAQCRDWDRYQLNMYRTNVNLHQSWSRFSVNTSSIIIEPNCIGLGLPVWTHHKTLWFFYRTSVFQYKKGNTPRRQRHKRATPTRQQCQQQHRTPTIATTKVIHRVRLYQVSHSDWKTWKNGKAFSSQRKVGEFWTDWKSQGKSHKILENSGNLR